MFISDIVRQPRRNDRRNEGRRHAWNNNESQRFTSNRSNSRRDNGPGFNQPPPRNSQMSANSADSWSIASNDGSTRGAPGGSARPTAPLNSAPPATVPPATATGPSAPPVVPTLLQQALMAELLQSMHNWNLNPMASGAIPPYPPMTVPNLTGGFGQNQVNSTNQFLSQPPQPIAPWQQRQQRDATRNRWAVPVNVDEPGPLQFDGESEIGKLQSEVRRLYSLSNSIQKKKSYAIIERLPEKPDEDTDQAYIRRAVYPVISSNQFNHSDPLEMYRLGEPRDSRRNSDGYEPKPRVVRVVFDTQQAAQAFIRLFRRSTRETFEDLDRKPFACRDLTPPELELQRALRKYCWEKNREAGRYVYRYSNLRVYRVEQPSDDSS